MASLKAPIPWVVVKLEAFRAICAARRDRTCSDGLPRRHWEDWVVVPPVVM